MPEVGSAEGERLSVQAGRFPLRDRVPICPSSLANGIRARDAPHRRGMSARVADGSKRLMNVAVSGGSAETPTTTPRPCLCCKLDGARFLYEILSCLVPSGGSSAAAQHSTLVIAVPTTPRNALRFVVEEAGCLQACVTLGRDMLLAMEVGEEAEAISFAVSLADMLDCLQLLSSISAHAEKALASPPLRMLYETPGGPLVLVAHGSESSLVQCRVQTIEPAAVSDFAFYDAPVLNTVVVQSCLLATAIAELDYGGATFGSIRLQPGPHPLFRWESQHEGGLASLTVDLPQPHEVEDGGGGGGTVAAAYHEFESLQAQVAAYRIALLKRCVKALGLSDVARVRLNAAGMLSVTARLRTAATTSAVDGVKGGRHRGALRMPPLPRHGPLGAGTAAVTAANACFFEFLIAADELATEATEHTAGG